MSESDKQYDSLLKETIEELEPLFFEELDQVGIARFDASRIRDRERQLDDSEFFECDIIQQLEEKYDCTIEYSQYDDYQVLHNEFQICISCGEAYKPKDWNYEYAGRVEDYQGSDFEMLQVDYDESHLRHLFGLYEDEFSNYLVKIEHGDYTQVMGTTGSHDSDVVYRYLLNGENDETTDE